jgi:hypothetical protein
MIQKCCFKGCERRGEPQQGFDFYACKECLTELERLIERRMATGEPRPGNCGPRLIQ